MGIMKKFLPILLLLTWLQSQGATAVPLKPHPVKLATGKTFNLSLPPNYSLKVAAEGFKRLRFLTNSPDGRLFVTDMYNLSDNRKGKVYILDKFDPATGRFRRQTTYLDKLHNPNNLAFYTAPGGEQWLYLALTDRLVRYRYRAGENAPNSAPQVLATFPAYGLSYKYGGWHLTRTVAVGPDGKIYVSVGSSCNACVEKEAVRATVLTMDPDGKNQRTWARGLRNAVGLKWVGSDLFATNMGADHLGDGLPDDTLLSLKDGAHYGWPYCYVSRSGVDYDSKYNPAGKKFDCATVPAADNTFAAHSAPLGLEYFDSNQDPTLQKSFLVALHGSGNRRIGNGYTIVQVREGEAPQTFIEGFLQGKTVYGRPADILRFGNGFLFSDDYSGVLYYVSK